MALDDMLAMLEPEAEPVEEAEEETEETEEETEEGEEEETEEGEEEESEEETDREKGDKKNALPEDFDLNEARIELEDGTEVSFKELETAYLKSQTPIEESPAYQDYVEAQRTLQESNKKVGSALESINALEEPTLKLLVSLIPPEPSTSLKEEDPDAYYSRKETREKVKEHIKVNWEKITGMRDQLLSSVVDQDELKKYEDQEKQLLLRSFPTLKNEKFSTEFFKTIKDTGKFLGFNDEELEGVKDHRMQKMLYLAGLGREVVKNKSKLLKGGVLKAEKAPNKAPAKKVKQLLDKSRTAPKKNAKPVRNGGISRAGELISWQDAMKIDWANLD